MKNIWILNHYAILPSSPGGTRHYDLACALQKRGYNVSVFAAGFHYTLFKDLKADQYGEDGCFHENIEGVNWYWLKTKAYEQNDWKRIRNMLSFSRRLLKTGKKIQDNNPDVIIGSIVHPFTPLAGIKLAKKFNASFVYEIRDLWPQTMIDMGAWSEKSPVSKYFWRLERKTVKHSDAVIALSPLTSDYLKHRYQFDNIHYIPNGIDIQAFDERFVKFEDDARKESAVIELESMRAKGFKPVMFTGTVNRSNNIDTIIDAAKGLKKQGETEIKLVIVGAGQEKDHYQKMIDDEKLDNICILNPVGKVHVPYLLNLAEALLLIQGKVMWGSMNKLFDYLASGKPIISAVEAGHNSPLTGLNSDLELSDISADKLVPVILKIKELSEDDKENIRSKSRKLVETEFNVSVLADRLEALLNGLNQDA